MKRASIITGIVMTGLIALGGTRISAQPANPVGRSIQIKNEGEAGFFGMTKLSMDYAINAARGKDRNKK